MKVFAVKDAAIDEFMNPFVAPHVGMAARSFEDEVLTSGSPINKHPRDYSLYCLGDYDPIKGLFDNGSGPQLIVRAVDIVEAKNVQKS